MERWKGKVAVITGASSGIGAATAKRLVDAGLIVAGLARRKEKIEEIAKDLEGKTGVLHAIKADVTKEEEVLEAFKWIKDNLGPVHILINNAGVLKDTTLADGDTKLWKAVIDTNFVGLCIATREAVKDMRANKVDGHIIHINSIAGYRVLKIPDLNVYPATKYAVTALTETLRQELQALGSKIKISSISPGVVATELFPKGSAFEVLPISIPSLKAEDVADAVVYVLGTPPLVGIHELILQNIDDYL